MNKFKRFRFEMFASHLLKMGRVDREAHAFIINNLPFEEIAAVVVTLAIELNVVKQFIAMRE